MNISYTLLASCPAVRTLYSRRMSFDWLTAHEITDKDCYLLHEATKAVQKLCRPYHNIQCYTTNCTLLNTASPTATILFCYCLPCAIVVIFYLLLQRVSIACYAERCISYSKSVRLSVRPSVRPSDRPSHAGTVSKRLKLWSWGLHCRIAPWL